jgi:hypothetical protein
MPFFGLNYFKSRNFDRVEAEFDKAQREGFDKGYAAGKEKWEKQKKPTSTIQKDGCKSRYQNKTISTHY